MSPSSDLVGALTPVVAALEQLGIRYQIGGSVASSVHGSARTTLDVDLIAEIRGHHASALTASLEGEFYVDEALIREAIQRRSCFNVIHLATMFKVDLFVAGDGPYELEALARGTSRQLSGEAASRAFRVAAPEDVVLSKLDWYRRGGERSERQWSDILGVIRVQGDQLDRAYLRQWAPTLAVGDLLERALGAA